MMTRLFALALVLTTALLTQPALSQEPRFSVDDDKTMSACVDAVRASLDGEPDPEAAGMPSASPKSFDDCIGIVSGPCMDTDEGMTTPEMSECMGRETDWWDGFLNSRYSLLRDHLDDETATALRDAQRAWIAFRDAECNLHYTYWRDGTIRSTFYSSCMLDMTARRAIELEDILRWG